MMCPGPYTASGTIINIYLYYFFNITCLCEPITILAVIIRQTRYLYIDHAVEGTLEVI